MTVFLHERPRTRFADVRRTFAAEPPEARGLARDDVRLLVATPGGVTHARFRDIGTHLRAGDVLVVNTSAVVPAQVDGLLRRARGTAPVVVHVATPLPDGTWVTELRSSPAAAVPVLDAEAGDVVDVADLGSIELRAPYPTPESSPSRRGTRLWRAEIAGDPAGARAALDRIGRPISYGYLSARWPLDAYRTVFATTPGSAEMASAARPFTDRLVTSLAARGVAFAPVVLHTGVSSQEAGEAPQPERFEVPPATTRLVEAVRAGGGRVVAVGTSATRALESAVDTVDGRPRVVARSGWTERVVTPDDPPRVTSGLVTGWHDPDASHLLLVEAVAGTALTQRAYDAALTQGYAWHEFGDSCLLLP